ncbi:acyltransferase family protein [Nonomuraea basaltis]|uniref:acyltransferase family protein n=1 Tax=Nonomuraea basaltis TaxID=2495887 RepID=UPI00110C4655|nr:acyltransferase family protein [Nonomuraea basaltis]TMR93820.1 acyltransferase [Nonomuraea basaltis]
MKTETRARLLGVDNLRVVLTALVVLHHVAVSYGNIPAWYYYQRATDPTGTALDVMVMFDQAFFMGFFFLISGFFTPSSRDRKGGGPFLRDRLKRLGIPLLAYLLLLRPLVTLGLYDGAVPYWKFYLASWDPGPMWFVEVLLVLAVGYVVIRRARPVPRVEESPLTLRRIALFALSLSAATFLWRFLVPVGTYWPVVGLPTSSYLPQYVSLFAVGVLAWRRGWHSSLPRAAVRIGFGTATAASLTLLPLSWMTTGVLNQLLAATWETVFAISLIIALTVLFRERFNRQGPFGRFLADQAYAVYVIHPLALVAVSAALDGLHTLAILKFTLVAAICLPLCWGLAYLVRMIPGAKRIL